MGFMRENERLTTPNLVSVTLLQPSIPTIDHLSEHPKWAKNPRNPSCKCEIAFGWAR